MRVAISGTHSSGKSTLIEDFIAAHGDYIHEPEPYEWLHDIYGEGDSDEPTAADFYRQIELSVDRWRTYEPGARVIGERSPLDFLAYMLALDDLERGSPDPETIDAAVELAADGLAYIDLLVVLPLEQRDQLAPAASEDLELRDAMNDRLLDLITTDRYALLDGGQPHVIDVVGARQERLRAVERAVSRLQKR